MELILLLVNLFLEKPLEPLSVHFVLFLKQKITSFINEDLHFKQDRGAKNNLCKFIHCRLGYQILKGIEAIHEVGFLHRDIKPSNFAGKMVAVQSGQVVPMCYFSWSNSPDYEEDLHAGLRPGPPVHECQRGGEAGQGRGRLPRHRQIRLHQCS